MGQYSKSKPKTTSGGYVRLTGEDDLSAIFTKAQSTVISNGTELEKKILSKSNTIDNLDKFIINANNGVIKKGIYICSKKTIKESENYSLAGTEPDFLIFDLSKTMKECTVLELKDGDAFDTKKSDSEYLSLTKYSDFIAKKIPFIVNFKICCFNQEDKMAIQKGLKGKFSLDDILTGKELCKKLHISYSNIIKERKNDQNENSKAIRLDFFKVKSVEKDIVDAMIQSGIDDIHIKLMLKNLQRQHCS